MEAIETFNGLVGAIYDAAIDPAAWPQVLQAFAAAFGSLTAHLSLDSATAAEGACISFGASPDFAQRYADYYAARNVVWQRMVERRLQGVLTNRIIMPAEEYRRSEFYNDFMRPEGGEEILLSTALRRADGETSQIVLCRSERLGAWSAGDVRQLSLLTPHLRRALQVNQLLAEMELERDLANEALHRLEHAVLIADAEARLLFVNRAAEDLFAQGGALGLERRSLTAARSADTAALRQLIHEAAESGVGGSMIITRAERPALIVHVVPAQTDSRWPAAHVPAAIVLIRDLEQRPALNGTALGRHFGLTQAQTEIARRIAEGETLQGIAESLEVTISTVRIHLQRVFDKTGTHRQADLVRLLLRTEAGVQSTDVRYRGPGPTDRTFS